MKNILLLIFLALGVGLLSSCKKDQIKMVRVDFYKQQGSAEVTVTESNNISRTFTMNQKDKFDIPLEKVSTIKFKMLSDGVVRINGGLYTLQQGDIFLWDKMSSNIYN